MDKSIKRGLNDRIYDKRKAAALELERVVRDSLSTGDTEKIVNIIKQLRNEYAYAVHQPNARYGGLIGLAAVAIALGQNEVPKYLESIMHPVLACFGDQDSMVRYFACEALYNIAKVAKGEILVYFNEIFDVLCKLVADVEMSVKNAADILDRLIKDITSEKAATYVSVLAKPVEPPSAKVVDQKGKTLQVYEPQLPKAFSLEKFIPLLKERMYATNPYTRMFLVSWLRLLDSIPGLNLISYLPSFLDALLSYLSATLEDVRVVTENFLKLLLHEIQKVSEIKKMVSQEKADDSKEKDLYIPGQDIVIDYPKIIDLLITSLDSTEELIQLVALQWLVALLEISPESFIVFMAKLLAVLLSTISHSNKQLRDISVLLNSKLMELAANNHYDINYTLIVNQLTLQFLNEKESTRLASLDWLIMLHEKDPIKFLEHSDNTFVTLLKAMNDQSDKVINKDLELLSKISNQTDDRYFQSFMVDLLNLFKRDRKLLDTRADFIIRTVCKSLDAERIYKSLSKVLSEEESNLGFLSIMIQILNNNLIIAPELTALRQKLIRGDDFDLFKTLFKCWSLNSASVLCLTLLTSNYKLSYKIVLDLANYEVSLNLLIQLDLLIQLLESPVFARLRLDLLNPQKNKYLFKCLYGLLMLLPQSNSFRTLQNRLNSITPIVHLQFEDDHDEKPSRDDAELLGYFDGSQKRLNNLKSSQSFDINSNFSNQLIIKDSGTDLSNLVNEEATTVHAPKKMDYITKFSGRLKNNK
ncbi:Protein involved in regulated synthesis of PtdIns(3,5)P(2) [Ogataea parapolymorpha DL-1]|uniref:Protein involved in regulated synthesis of PtdIns(3,5)P(2) n=1 Tax=Ogataea parapolymorpha (strain ATCC 26012 / BCRC 20466 / JCM 22074 / NRRL Y-7560 / DL-1) TaxID=871575 RepID=W1QC09_OGAPD|nr:Protein involved in regulated synthesis of PtdIns(3,5)P(2) [Ogataea parapolymorpha DL-1]ESW97873.1 Protein involved in regulated synthesis of PtdIns(3,5)P(2) [Ogataea parapolymorpha DL-1]